MGTPVNDPVHVQIQMIEFGQQGVIGHDLVDLRVPFADPAVKLFRHEKKDRQHEEKGGRRATLAR
jgi:hypothetical protein